MISRSQSTEFAKRDSRQSPEFDREPTVSPLRPGSEMTYHGGDVYRRRYITTSGTRRNARETRERILARIISLDLPTDLCDIFTVRTKQCYRCVHNYYSGGWRRNGLQIRCDNVTHNTAAFSDINLGATEFALYGDVPLGV